MAPFLVKAALKGKGRGPEAGWRARDIPPRPQEKQQEEPFRFKCHQ